MARDANYTPETDPAGFVRFAKRHREQIRELLTNYGKIDMMCLDMHLPDFCWPGSCNLMYYYEDVGLVPTAII